MSNDLDDLEAVRARIRNEARQRRQQQFLLRRAARSSPNGNTNSDSSRSSSPDLLASPPPPSVVASAGSDGRGSAEVSSTEDNASIKRYGMHNHSHEHQAASPVAKSDARSTGNASMSRSGARDERIQEKNNSHHKTPQHSDAKETASKSTVKIKRKRFAYESSSSSEEDEAEIAKRFASKQKKFTQVKSQTATSTRSNNIQWGNSDSESSSDAISRRRAARRKTKEIVPSNNGVENECNLSDEELEYTPKISNEGHLQRFKPSNEKMCSDSGNGRCLNDQVCTTNTTTGNLDEGNNYFPRKNDKLAAPAETFTSTNNQVFGATETCVESENQKIGSAQTDNESNTLVHEKTVANSKQISTNASPKTTAVGKQDWQLFSKNSRSQQSEVKHSVTSSSIDLTGLGQIDSSKATVQSKSTINHTTAHAAAAPQMAATCSSQSDTGNSVGCKSPPGNDINTDPIIAKSTSTPSNVQWSVHKQCLIVRTIKGNKKGAAPRTKVAGFDLDQTLVQWRCSGWPSRPEHYELWNASVVPKLKELHDEGYKLVIFSNQGGIRGAFQGKNATRVKGIIDWIANLIDRPLYAVCSTKKDSGYHKGKPGMWTVMEDMCNGGVKAQPALSFFVGDSDGTGANATDPKQQQYQAEGVDKSFAENVGKLRSVEMKFFTPDSYFGRSNSDTRRTLATIGASVPLSKEVMAARAALLGGYLSSPILLVLCGVQGSGKSTLSAMLCNGNSNWCHYSQDTISNGKPGKREAVEAAAIASLQEGKNVVIDRMHLTPEQRQHFVNVGKQCDVPVHALVMIASKEEVHERVKRRTNHPGKVEGEHGARIAISSLAKMIMPTYEEGFALISYTHDANGLLTSAYRQVSNSETSKPYFRMGKTIELYNSGRNTLSMITFGTMSISKRDAESAVSQAIQTGIEAIDTAPTYNNEVEVGHALAKYPSVRVVIKVPKRVTTADEARSEVQKSLKLLGRSSVDVILLHWPSDLIEGGSLLSVWKELEAMQKEGLCSTIGVSNFTIDALTLLLSQCEVKPAINQVERHPLLPQYDLLEYCQSQGIVIQSHTPLGHGNKVLMKHQTILQVSDESRLTPAQVLLLWNLQQGVPVVTKFSVEEHSRDIIPIMHSKLSLSTQQMQAIDKVCLSDESTRFVAPPFMYKHGAAYSWGSTSPSKA